MANKLVFVLLGLLCLVPTFAAPTPESHESSEEINLNGFVERLKLLAITLEEFTNLYTEIVDKGPKVFVEVLKDPKVVEVKTEAMESQIKVLRDYVDKFEAAQKDDKKEHIFELVEEYSEIVDKFDSKKDTLTPEAKIIETSLNENGLKAIEDTIFSHFESFLKKFSVEVDQYLSGLDEKGKINEKEFIEWYEKLKAEKDTEKQIEMFDNFIEVEDD